MGSCRFDIHRVTMVIPFLAKSAPSLMFVQENQTADKDCIKFDHGHGVLAVAFNLISLSFGLNLLHQLPPVVLTLHTSLCPLIYYIHKRMCQCVKPAPMLTMNLSSCWDYLSVFVEPWPSWPPYSYSLFFCLVFHLLLSFCSRDKVKIVRTHLCKEDAICVRTWTKVSPKIYKYHWILLSRICNLTCKCVNIYLHALIMFKLRNAYYWGIQLLVTAATERINYWLIHLGPRHKQTVANSHTQTATSNSHQVGHY